MKALRPDRWTAHHPTKCGLDELPEGYSYCRCPEFWPRPAAYWQGETAIGCAAVGRLLAKYRLVIGTQS